jgi:phosphinothricin acetyltransferase
VTFETELPPFDEMARRIDEISQRFPYLVVDDGRSVAAFAYASAHRVRQAYQWSAEVSVYVAPELQRKGAGRRLYCALFALLRLQGIVNAYAGITLPNLPSVRLHESLGFEPIGIYRRVGYKLGAWHDVGWWSLRLQEPAGEPSPPRSSRSLSADPRWLAALTAGS